MQENNERLCKQCGLLKKRIFAGKFDLKNKRWIGDSGKLWNGSVCPECHAIKAKENMRKLRRGF